MPGPFVAVGYTQSSPSLLALAGPTWRLAWGGAACAALLVTQLSCGASDEGSPDSSGVTPPSAGANHAELAAWGLFADAAQQVPASGVEPFQPIAPLYSDYANKRRFIYIPSGTKIGYSADGVWQLPVGGILIKTFSYQLDQREPAPAQIGPDTERLLETRLLYREGEAKWRVETYVWDAKGERATREVAGAVIDATWTDAAGQERTNAYGVPNLNACQTCHGSNADLNALGLFTRQLDWDYEYPGGNENQVDHFASLGWLDSAAAEPRQRLVDPFGGASASDRVRSYFDSNCASCHRDGAFAESSGLYLDYASTDPAGSDPAVWGVCKQPTSAGGATCGLTWDVVPGKPDESILLCRVEAKESQVRMPPLGSKLPHAEAAQLIRTWIEALPPAPCSQ